MPSGSPVSEWPGRISSEGEKIMASRTSTEYASKKEFSASLIEFRHFDLLRVNGESLQGDWSTNRSARGANTIYDLYAKAAGLLAKPDFPRFLAAAGRFVSDSEEKYYALWRMVDGKEYFLFKNLSNIAKFEALWDWAQALGAAITLSDGEGAEEQTDDPFDYDSANVEVDFGGNDAASASAITPLLVHAHAPRNCSIGSKGGKTMLYDEDDEKFISLPFDDIEGELGEIEEYEDLEGCGWKYRTEPKGRWGYISPDYAQVISPRFEEILLRSTELQLLTGESNVLAWSRDENNPLSRLDLNFWFSYAGLGNKLRLCRLAELRDAAATLESDNSSLFLPNAFEESMRRATLTLRGSFSVGGEFRCLLRADPIYRFVYEDSKGAVYVEALENGKEGLRLGGSNYPLMAKNLTLDQCEDALASPVEYRSLRYLYSSIRTRLLSVFPRSMVILSKDSMQTCRLGIR